MADKQIHFVVKLTVEMTLGPSASFHNLIKLNPITWASGARYLILKCYSNWIPKGTESAYYFGFSLKLAEV